jgi:hypothetical protein
MERVSSMVGMRRANQWAEQTHLALRTLAALSQTVHT